MKIFYIFLFYFYIFSTQFIFVPGHLGTRVLIGIIGMSCFSIYMSRNKISRRLKYNLITIIMSLVPIAFLSALTMIINGSMDAEFIKYFFSMIIVFFASYFVAETVLSDKKNDIFYIIDLIKYVSLLHLVIALCAFLMPSLKNFIVDIQAYDYKSRSDSDYIFAARLVGLGPSFFVAGIVYCCTLVLMTYKFMFKKMSSREVTTDVCAYLFIILFGIFTSRMTIMGLLFSILLVFFTKRRDRQNKWKKVLPAALLIIPFITFVYINTIYNNPDMEIMVNHGFEMLNNAQDKGEANSASTNRLLEMYEEYPSEVSSYLYGDGFFSSPKGDGYYKNIDIGYFRLIYYFGIIGTLFYFLFQYKVLLLMKKSYKRTNTLIRILLFLLLIINLKGFADIASITLLFTFNES